MRLLALYATSIICGFCMMALEIMGGRVLQPIFGSSIDVWAAIITVFILSLSIGYVLGGRLADKVATNAALGWMIVVAGVFFLLLPLYALPVQESFSQNLQNSPVGVLIAALILFLPASLLLGAVSPLLVRLVFVDAARVGRTTGTLYAVGSVGNVLGILVSDYVLLKYVDLNHNLLVMGGVLGVLGVAHLLVKVSAHSDEAKASAAQQAAAVA